MELDVIIATNTKSRVMDLNRVIQSVFKFVIIKIRILLLKKQREDAVLNSYMESTAFRSFWQQKAGLLRSLA